MKIKELAEDIESESIRADREYAEYIELLDLEKQLAAQQYELQQELQEPSVAGSLMNWIIWGK